MKKLIVAIMSMTCVYALHAQCASPPGDQSTYGTNDVWIGYVYDNMNFTGYMGYMNEGTAGNPSFDENFGGDYATFPINGCSVYAETFSIRYKLTKAFSAGDYEFDVGGDDGFRLSLDGGTTWVINRWNDQAYTQDTYTVHLNGTYNIVLEYYENGVNNRISFSIQHTCIGTDDPSTYGTGNVWKGYVYDGTNFNIFKGLVTEGIASTCNFDESFGGDYVNYNTNTCSIYTETFSVRYRLRKYFANSNYLITVGADDGYRLSLDDGATWVINQWSDHSYGITSYNAALNGTYDMVLEYYENGGGNRVSFAISGIPLPLSLLNFKGEKNDDGIILSWQTTFEDNTSHFDVERSTDGRTFEKIGQVMAKGNSGSNINNYSFTDVNPVKGKSYYRLAMIDKDGQFTYSPVININTDVSTAIKIYPSILEKGGRLFIQPQSDLRNSVIVISDISGKKIYEQRISAANAMQIVPVDVPGKMSNGMYLVSLYSERDMIEKKMIFIH